MAAIVEPEMPGWPRRDGRQPSRIDRQERRARRRDLDGGHREPPARVDAVDRLLEAGPWGVTVTTSCDPTPNPAAVALLLRATDHAADAKQARHNAMISTRPTRSIAGRRTIWRSARNEATRSE